MRSDKRENKVYLSIGTNIGDRLLHINDVKGRLQKLAIKEIIVSPIYETEGWGEQFLSPFFNIVVQIVTSLKPLALLEATQSIEQQMGRGAKSVNNVYENRIIDIDILTFNNQTFNSQRLQIPHPQIVNRRFVLMPFADVDSNHCLPHSLQSIGNYLDLCADYSECKKISIGKL